MAQSSVIGFITAVYEPQSGTSAAGNSWMRQSFVVKKISSSQRDSFVQLDIMGADRIAAIQPAVGKIGEFFFDAESRESQKEPGKWFTSLTCYKAQPFQMAAQQQPVMQQAVPQVAQNVVPQGGFQQQTAPSQGWSQPGAYQQPAGGNFQQHGWQQQGGFQQQPAQNGDAPF